MQAIYRHTAVKAAKEAGKIQLRYFGKRIIKKRKKNQSYVTKADIESAKKIRSIILRQFPEHSIVDEELGSAKKKSDYKWIIDPLDGTHNFVMGNPLFGVSVALQHKKEIVLGVIYFPSLRKLYCAEKGKKAFCNGKQVRVNNETKLKRCVVVFGGRIGTNINRKMALLKRLARAVWRLRRYGAAVYHNVMVAEGNASINIAFDSNSWDHSAALLIVEEAGGKATAHDGKRWHPGMKNYVASNGKIHDKILNVLKK